MQGLSLFLDSYIFWFESFIAVKFDDKCYE